MNEIKLRPPKNKSEEDLLNKSIKGKKIYDDNIKRILKLQKEVQSLIFYKEDILKELDKELKETIYHRNRMNTYILYTITDINKRK